ncbi:Site-specific recombinase XerD [Micrococcales bacterium KH10]|nr:Site-specific recombinase XerD [Micrococcales bacterium KH10]
MPRPPLPIGAWGKISRSQAEPGKHRARARFRDHDGVTRLVEAWGKSGAAAERALITALTERKKHTGADITSESRLGDVAELWFKTEVEPDKKKAPNTIQRYGDLVDKKIVPGIGKLKLRECSPTRLTAFLRKETEESGPSSARLCRTVLTSILAYAVLSDALLVNPMREVGAIEVRSKKVESLSVEQVRKLRKDLKSDKKANRADLPDLVDFMLGTGCRIGEALAVRWSDIDLVARTVTITGTVIRVSGQGVVRQGNTKGKSERIMKVPTFIPEMLERRRIEGPHPGEYGVVFPSAAGGLREVTTVEWQWRQFKGRHSQWSWVHPHVFRKTAATVVAGAMGSKVAADLLGHANVPTTEGHYAKKERVVADATAALDELAR